MFHFQSPPHGLARRNKVSTTAFANNLLILYKLKKDRELSPRFNYQVYYKIGSLALNNDARQRFADGSISSVPEHTESNQFIREKALITGLGVGANWRFSGNFSFIANMELNRSTHKVSDILQPQTIFFHSEKTLTNYAMLTLGLSYTPGVSPQKTGFSYEQKATYKKQVRPRHYRIKKNNTKGSHFIWFKDAL